MCVCVCVCVCVRARACVRACVFVCVWCIFSALLVSLPATVLLVTLVCLSGLVIYATYHDCDPLLSGDLVSKDQVTLLFAVYQ